MRDDLPRLSEFPTQTSDCFLWNEDGILDLVASVNNVNNVVIAKQRHIYISNSYF